jgi:amidohydrolase
MSKGEGSMYQRLSAEARTTAPLMTEWRRYLHANPELSFAEHETTGWVAEKLEQWNIPYTRPTPTGLVGLIEGDRPGRTIAIRADIDALPIEEASGLPFSSTHPGVMHACGHDGHTAILLGLSRFFAANRDFAGRIKLLFQPAEEKAPGGAQAYVKAGVLNDVDACIGLHLLSDRPTGTAAISAGPVMANSDSFSAQIRGRGGHGASPHETIDAVMVACHAVVNLQTVVSRKVDPTRPAVVTVGSIHGGTTFNVIADTAELKGTVRSFQKDVRQLLHDEIKRTLEATCAMYGATMELSYMFGYPALVNHPEMAEVLRQAAGVVLGATQVGPAEPTMGGEDFAYYCEAVPSAYLFLGARNSALGADWPHHHPRFTVDEAALPHGMAILGHAALELLR